MWGAGPSCRAPNRLTVDLRCDLRFEKTEAGVRAVLDARDASEEVRASVSATGPDEGRALAALAERTREFYGAACQMVETVEELARAYLGSDDEGAPER